MFCTNCGKENDPTKKFCTNCGKPLGTAEKSSQPIYASPKKRKKFGVKSVIWILVVVGIIVAAIYGSQDQQAQQTNNTAVDTANSNDTVNSDQQAIEQFKNAYNNATDNSTKMGVLENLAVAYDNDGDTSLELSTWQEALSYADQGSSDYYYISGEIAELQNQPANALSDLTQAYQLDPQRAQLSSELGLFYLDLNSSWTSYDDNAKALQYLKGAYDLNANDTSTENLAEAYYYNNDFQEATSLLTPLDLTSHPYAAVWLGLAYEGENDPTDAKLYFQKALNLGDTLPQSATNYLNSN